MGDNIIGTVTSDDIRRAEKINGELYNIEFMRHDRMKDPGKLAKN